MAVPTRSEALALLAGTSPSPRLMQHVTVAAEVASFLAHRMALLGEPIDRRLAETAALLHDIDKALPREHPLLALGHGRAGAEYLAQAGHPELVRAVADHPVMRLLEADGGDWLESASLEARLVAYADKRAMQRVVSLDVRFARWYRRHPQHRERLKVAHERARLLEASICERAGLAPGQVLRLRWVEEAAARLGTGSRHASARPADPPADPVREGSAPALAGRPAMR